MESEIDFWTAKALLEWQLEMGVNEAIGDAPVNRFELPDSLPKPAAPAPTAPAAAGAPASPSAPPAPVEKTDPVAEARAAAAGASDLDALAAAMEAFEHSPLKQGARSFVFSDGNPSARVMIIGEAPGRDEDRQGKPFVGRAGQLLDRMFAAIGMGRAETDPARAVYIANVLPWRPPENRRPDKGETAMFLPFLEAHVRLAQPELLVLMGNTPCETLLGRAGITRIRGKWTEALGLPALPMFHPAYLLRNPGAKREAWADLLELQARLRGRA